MIPGRRQQSHDRFLEKWNKATGYPSLIKRDTFLRFDPSRCKSSKLRSQLTNQSSENTWRFIPESICKAASLLNLCFNRLKCSLTVRIMQVILILHLLPHFLSYDFAFLLACFFLCLGQFFEVSVSTIPSPTLVHRRVFSKRWICGMPMFCRQWQVVRLTRGQLFGELALMGDQPRAATARCAMPQDRKNSRWTELLMLILEKQKETWTTGEWSWIMLD